MSDEQTVAFIGGGNMAEALIGGARSLDSTVRIRVADPAEARRTHLRATYGVEAVEDNATAARGADVVVLAIKPQVFDAALGTIAAEVGLDALIITVAAGVPLKRLAAALPGRGLVRAMPNTPALVGAGATAIAVQGASEAQGAWTRRLFAALGLVVEVPESQLDAVTGLSGSGPAFVMLVLEALADGGVAAGLPRDVAQQLATQTVLGAATLQARTGDHPGVLKDRVTSPGGTTIAGLTRLEAAGARSAFIDAVQAAAARSAELGAAAEEME